MIKKVKDVFKKNKEEFSKEELEQQFMSRSITILVVVIVAIIYYGILPKMSSLLEKTIEMAIFLGTTAITGSVIKKTIGIYFEHVADRIDEEIDKRKRIENTRKLQSIAERLVNQDYASLMILCPEIEFLLKQHLMRLYLKKNVVKVEMKEEGIKIQMKTRVIWINWEEVTELFDLKENESQIIDSLFFEEDDEELL